MLCILELRFQKHILEVIVTVLIKLVRTDHVILVLDVGATDAHCFCIVAIDSIFEAFEIVGLVHDRLAVSLRILLHGHHGEVSLDLNCTANIVLWCRCSG